MPKVPTKATLKKYGLSELEWTEIAVIQDCVCAICKKLPKSGRLNIDHQHVPKYKDMPPEEKNKYIRGLLCYICNHRIMTRGITIEKLKNAVDYMVRYERRIK